MTRSVSILAFVVLLLAGALSAADEKFERDWREFRMPPFEVLTEQDSDDTRAFLGDLYQFRRLLEVAFPGKELRAQWPIRIWLLNDQSLPAGAPDEPIPVVVDRYVVVLGRPPQLTASLKYRIAQRILTDNLRPMPGWFERGLLSILGGARIDGQEIYLGAPSSGETRTLDWARVHTLLLSKQSVPVLSAMTGNLEKGMDIRLAMRNSYQSDLAKVDATAKQTLAGGEAATVFFSGLANNPKEDFRDWPVPLGYEQLARLSLYAARGQDANLQNALGQARAQYDAFDARARVQMQALDALDAIASGETAEGQKILKTLTAIGVTDSPRVYLEAAKLGTTKAEKRRLAELAKEQNPEWAEIYRFFASLEEKPSAQGTLLLEAARRNPRSQTLWEEAANVLVEARKFGMADTALDGAERSTDDPAEKQRLRDQRWDLKELRAQKDEEDRRAQEAEARKEIEALKEKTMSRIEEALARANKANAPENPEDVEVIDYGDRDEKETITGKLIAIECRSGGNLVLEIVGETERTRLFLPDPSKIAIEGGGTLEFRCGAQPNPKTVTAQYLAKTNAVLGTIGEVEILRPE